MPVLVDDAKTQSLAEPPRRIDLRDAKYDRLTGAGCLGNDRFDDRSANSTVVKAPIQIELLEKEGLTLGRELKPACIVAGDHDYTDLGDSPSAREARDLPGFVQTEFLNQSSSFSKIQALAECEIRGRARAEGELAHLGAIGAEEGFHGGGDGSVDLSLVRRGRDAESCAGPGAAFQEPDELIGGADGVIETQAAGLGVAREPVAEDPDEGLGTAFKECTAELREAQAFGDHHAVDGERTFLEQKAEHAGAEAGEGGADVGVVGEEFLDGEVRLAGFADDSSEQLVLGTEVGVEGGLRDAGGAGDGVHADVAVTVGNKQVGRTIQDLLALRGLGLGGSRGGGAHGGELDGFAL